jgi:hypothetical protein
MGEKARSRRMGIRLRWMSVPAFLMLFVIFMVPFFYDPQWQWNVSSQADDQTPTLPLQSKPGESHVQALINAVRTATAAAAAVKNKTFSDQDARVLLFLHQSYHSHQKKSLDLLGVNSAFVK